jgi:hypothetical protein
MPESEKLRKAVRWISEETSDSKKAFDLISEASIRFNLSPKETDYLHRFLTENKDDLLGGSN